MKILRDAAVLVAGAVAGLVTAAAVVPSAATSLAGHARATTSLAGHARAACPAGYSCPGDPVDFIDQSQTADPQFIISDPSNAPQFSVGTGGAASWANPLCITNNPLTTPPLRFVACIGGAWGNGQGRAVITLFSGNGRAYRLTIADIAFLHHLEAAASKRGRR